MKKQKQGAPNVSTVVLDADSVQQHADARAEQLSTTLRSLEAAGERLSDNVPAPGDGPETWALTAVNLEAVGRQLAIVASGVSDAASYFHALSQVARASVPSDG